MRWLERAAAAVAAVGAAALMGASALGYGPAALAHVSLGSLAIPPWKDAPAESRLEPPETTGARALARARVGRGASREPGAQRVAGLTPAGRPPRSVASAPPSPTRTARNRPRPTALPAGAPGPTSPPEAVEPLPATPLLTADTAAIPPSVTTPPSRVGNAAQAAALEVTRVDVRPAVVKRVGARHSRATQRNPEMVVLRVLVSTTGSPATVHILRGSKTDPTTDDVAVAAVQRWTFSPAFKDGHPVDCWFNIAVPVEGAAQ